MTAYWAPPAPTRAMSLAIRRCTDASAAGPESRTSPMWERSKSPARLRTARCSSRIVEYCSGMSKPANSTMRAPAAMCLPYSGVRAAIGPASLVRTIRASRAGLDSDPPPAMIIAAVVLGAVVVALAAAFLFLRQRLLLVSLPRVRGTVEVDGLSARVTIARDAFGIPHIDAASLGDAALAMGIAHAQDRLWQLEVTRRVAAGRVSEFAGAEGIALDRFVRRLGLFRVARQELADMDAET